ncbi:MAG: hypothetical protein ABIY70_24760 [Capsulimonas sp.]|uniref:hypothetical protein n=1 Tax=Capsulimonas sp. TaxID=2494211 RepID=UPI0032635E74
MNISYPERTAPVNNYQQAHIQLSDPDLAARVDSIRETGAFLYRKPRYANQSIDVYDYYDASDLDAARYAVIVRNRQPFTCSCPDNKIRQRQCKHMGLLAEQLTDGRAMQTEVTPVCKSARPPKDEARPYYSFPPGTPLIIHSLGYLDINTVQGELRNGMFYVQGETIGTRVTHRKETDRERQTRLRQDVDEIEGASDWK